MRLHIRHETSYAYTAPARRAVETLRLTPGGHESQFVVKWRVGVDRDCILRATTDPFGNSTHNFTLEGPIESFAIVAEGVVETGESSGVLKGAVERFPPALYLRDTSLTEANGRLRRMAEATADGASDRITLLHQVMETIRANMRFEIDQTDTGTSAGEAMKLGHGVCQDFVHVFLAMTRHLDIPARYVGGYLLRDDGADEQAAGHAWAEAYVDDLGWIGFDPANGVSPTEAYVRAAVGLDYLGAAPVRGMRYGGEGETLSVRIHVNEVGRS